MLRSWKSCIVCARISLLVLGPIAAGTLTPLETSTKSSEYSSSFLDALRGVFSADYNLMLICADSNDKGALE